MPLTNPATAGPTERNLLRPRQAPGARQIVTAIGRREIGLAARRKLVRLLFLFSILPPVILTVIIVVRIFAEQMTGSALEFDPLLHFLRFQALPIALLAFGLGTPLVAQDRAEDVLFLYATRPVQPWHYALGKMAAVALPCFGLFLFPGLLIAVLRLGITREFGAGEALFMVLKLAFAGLVVAWGYAGLTVGPSALTKRARWAQLLSLVLVIVPGAIVEATAQVTGLDLPPIGAPRAVDELLTDLFGDGSWAIAATLVLLAYGFLGYLLTMLRVKREMIP